MSVETLEPLDQCFTRHVREHLVTDLAQIVLDYALFAFKRWRLKMVFEAPSPIGDALMGPDGIYWSCPSQGKVLHVQNERVRITARTERDVLFQMRHQTQVIPYMDSLWDNTYYETRDLSRGDIRGYMCRVADTIHTGSTWLSVAEGSYSFCRQTTRGSFFMASKSRFPRHSDDKLVLCPKTFVWWKQGAVVISNGQLVWLNLEHERPVVAPLLHEDGWSSVSAFKGKLYATSGCGMYEIRVQGDNLVA